MSRYKDTPLIFELETCHEGSRYIRPLDVPKPDFAEWFGDAYREGKPISPMWTRFPSFATSRIFRRRTITSKSERIRSALAR